MLGNEYRVAAEWRLLAVIARLRRCETLRNEVARMIENSGFSLCRQILALLRAQRKTAAEAGLAQRREKLIEISHLVFASLTCE